MAQQSEPQDAAAFMLAQSAYMSMMQAAQTGYFAQMQKNSSNTSNTPMSMSPIFQPPPFNMFSPTQMWNTPMTAPRDHIPPTEEDHIIKALSTFIRQGKNHNEALNSLDGVSSSMFRDLNHLLMFALLRSTTTRQSFGRNIISFI